MRTSILERDPKSDVAVFIVWIPMIPTDNRWAAGQSSKMFSDPRVVQYYDDECRLGWAYTRGPFKDCHRQGFEALPKDHPLKDEYSPDHASPAWDVYFFYPPGARWMDPPPVPARWVKQSGYESEDRSELWRNDCTVPPIYTSLVKELAIQMDELTRRR